MSALDTALLKVLHTAGVHLPAGELAIDLATTTTTIHARVAELRAAGFEIEERPELGYRLLTSPDRLMADDLRARLGESDLIRDILVFAETDSTNDRAAQLGSNGAAGGVAIFAEHQTAGRGRFGRAWESASHLGLWCSLLLRPQLSLADWPRLTTWAAVGTSAGIRKALGIEVQIKWPNDLQIRGRKVAGILIETGVDTAQQPFAVVGLGVNANHTENDFGPELLKTAGSLRQMTGRIIDRAELAVAIFQELEARTPLLKDAFHELVAEAAARSMLLGKPIQVRAGESLLAGVAEALDAAGHLIVRDATGMARRLPTGEITVCGDYGA